MAFLVARYIARGAIEQRLEGDRRFAAIDRAVGREGRKIVFLLRLSPVFPFNLLNYALGLTNVRFVDYFIACLGMIPGTLLYIYYGKLAGDVAPARRGRRCWQGDRVLRGARDRTGGDRGGDDDRDPHSPTGSPGSDRRTGLTLAS